MKIICVIVTYNRCSLLKKCLDSVITEGFKKDEILVIDNNSNDDTELLISTDYNLQVTYYKLDTNIGGAGGFHEGFRIAYENGADFILAFDDDVEMLPGAMSIYTKYTTKGDIIVGRKKNTDGSDFEFGHNINLNTGKLKKISKYDEDVFMHSQFIQVNAITFEGVLISKKVLERIGLPEKDFFIQGDDAWFGIKASIYGFTIIYIKDYTFTRLLGERVRIIFGKKMEKLKAFSLYYQIRNKFLLNKLLNEELGKKTNHSLAILGFCILVIPYILVTQENKIALLNALFNGFKDGYLGKVGK